MVCGLTVVDARSQPVRFDPANLLVFLQCKLGRGWLLNSKKMLTVALVFFMFGAIDLS
jgi:hypothetical protein